MEAAARSLSPWRSMLASASASLWAEDVDDQPVNAAPATAPACRKDLREMLSLSAPDADADCRSLACIADLPSSRSIGYTRRTRRERIRRMSVGEPTVP